VAASRETTVNLGKTARQIRREATRSPKKAAVLGLLCIVALWFWAPLVWDWLGEDGTASTEATSAAMATVPAAARIGTPANSGPSSQPTPGKADASSTSDGLEHSWQQLLQWRNEDPRSRPAGSAAGDAGPATALLRQLLPSIRGGRTMRDPFHRPSPPQQAVIDVDEQQEVQQQPAPPPTPEQLGATLTSTLTGQRGAALAMINGNVYRLGDEIELSDERQVYRFRLERIRSRVAVLIGETGQYELRIPLPLEQASSGGLPSAATAPAASRP